MYTHDITISRYTARRVGWLKRAALVLAVALTAVVLIGCGAHNTITNLPTGVTQVQVNDWATAVNVLQQAQAATHAAVAGTLSLRQAGVYQDTPAYTAAITAEGRAEQIELTLAQYLKVVPDHWSASIKSEVASYTAQILAQLASAAAQGILGQKAQGASQTIAQLIANATSLVQSIANGIASISSRVIPVSPSPAWRLA